MTFGSGMSPLAKWLWVAGLATALSVAVLMVWVDIPLALYFHTYRDTDWANFFAAITDFANGAIWYGLAVLGIGFAYLRWKRLPDTPNVTRWTKELRAWLFMIATMASSGIFINAIKFAVGRERPRFLFRDGTSDFHPFALRIADCAFPSGHTQSIWTAMLCLSLLFPKGRAIFIPVAVMISASRVIIGAHYLSDVVASIFIAFAFTLLWRRWFERGGETVILQAPSGQPAV